MRIVLEGCDCTGKSELAKFLAPMICEAYNVKQVEILHEALPPDVPSLFEFYAVKAIAHDFCIHDRLHLGERTYGPVRRNRDNLGEVGQHIIDHIIRSNGFGVICSTPFDEILPRWRKRIDREYIKDDTHLREIHSRYTEFFDDGDAWMFINPFISSDRMQVARRIIEMAEQTSLIPFVWGIGPSTAETLIVGEMSNHPIYDLPFFSTKGSSSFLIRTLIRLGIGHNYYLTNAYRKDGVPRLMKPIITRLPEIKRVIALGHQSSMALKRQGIPHEAVPHPQFYYRFRHNDMDEYVKQFQEVMEEAYAAKLHLL